MKKRKLYWKDAIELLENDNDVSPLEIDFRNEKIPIKEVGFLNKHQIRVPENLISYDDENIDCSDIPEITEEDIKSSKIQWIKMEEFPIDKEIRNWVVSQKINLNELLPHLLENFYQSIKFAKKNQL
ncbi:MAG: hypothetical protein HN704_16960 [Bacteroidetes bacterium]|jgi:hypothetical protein|nr:hypothetical protein [Bacteroidota bacterium]MBT6687721.1 hypothetical protein [Bacteroidota bacterium]MBT7143685.1 hypothetical protein [Bacteroidota bacterium]MBT7493291.1 hypothetical protein [Bacteroidota bacterium]